MNRKYPITDHRYLFVLVCGAALLVICLVCVVATKPAHNAVHILSELHRIDVGRTKVSEVRALAQQYKDSDAAFICLGDSCTFTFLASNALLSRIRVAPPSYLLVNVICRGEFVSDVIVRFDTGERGQFAHFDFVQGLPDSPEYYPHRCGKDVCILVERDTDHIPKAISVALLPTADHAQRDRYLSLRADCLSRIGGCKDVRQVVEGGLP